MIVVANHKEDENGNPLYVTINGNGKIKADGIPITFDDVVVSNFTSENQLFFKRIADRTYLYGKGYDLYLCTNTEEKLLSRNYPAFINSKISKTSISMLPNIIKNISNLH